MALSWRMTAFSRFVSLGWPRLWGVWAAQAAVVQPDFVLQACQRDEQAPCYPFHCFDSVLRFQAAYRALLRQPENGRS